MVWALTARAARTAKSDLENIVGRLRLIILRERDVGTVRKQLKTVIVSGQSLYRPLCIHIRVEEGSSLCGYPCLSL
jgi:hypothetical protein